MTHPVSSVFHRDLIKEYKTIVSGSGVYLYDSEGRRYLDAVGGAGVAVIGHGVPGPLRALAEASDTMAYVYGEDFTTPWQEEFAERLLDLFAVRGGAVYFVSGGSEANETAIKMAREYHLQRGQPQRHKIIARWQSFHGVTLGTLWYRGAPHGEVPSIPTCTTPRTSSLRTAIVAPCILSIPRAISPALTT